MFVSWKVPKYGNGRTSPTVVRRIVNGTSPT